MVRKDPNALGATLAEDFSWWIVAPNGPNRAVQGRTETVKLLDGFFRNAQWYGSKVCRLGMVGNMLVHVEVEAVGAANGPVEKTSLEIYAFCNGRRWREWRFLPESLAAK